jgi:hypothetical protein
MSKGSAPRNIFSKQFRSNYDSIDWSSSQTDDRELVNDCPSMYRWPEGQIINGCGDDQDESTESEDDSCANE